MEQPKLTPEQAEMNKSRILNEADLVKRGAEYEPNTGTLNISEEEEKRLKLENQEVVAENLKDYIKKFKEVVIPAEENNDWKDKEPGYCLFSGFGRFYFIDKDHNWNRVTKIETEKIASLRNIPKGSVSPFGEAAFTAIKRELKESGLDLDLGGNFHAVEMQIERMNIKKSEAEAAERQKSFDI